MQEDFISLGFRWPSHASISGPSYQNHLTLLLSEPALCRSPAPLLSSLARSTIEQIKNQFAAWSLASLVSDQLAPRMSRMSILPVPAGPACHICPVCLACSACMSYNVLSLDTCAMNSSSCVVPSRAGTLLVKGGGPRSRVPTRDQRIFCCAFLFRIASLR